MSLTVKGVDAKREPGMYADGGGLYLRVGPTGGKSWIVRTVIHGKRRELGIGAVQHLGLADARSRAAEIVGIARAGGDPDADRKAEAKAAREAQERANMTFERAAKMVHAKLLPSWRNKKHAETWIGSIELHANPKIGRKAIEKIGRDDVLKVLSPIWTEKIETAKRLKQRLELIFDWASGEGHYPHPNPVRGLRLALPKVAAADNHLAAMPWRDLPAFWAELSERDGMSAYCLRFAILTAARSGEARGARWSEIDWEGKIWNLPAERMKRNKPHRVPLAPAAIEILEIVRGLDAEFCFPSPQKAKTGGGKPMSDMAFKLLYNRMEVSGFTSHGFRSTFRDWCSESAKADPELAEAALSHATGNAVTRAYARSDLFDRRRDLMEAWGRFVTGETAGAIVQMVRG